jgi:hypothetical protein
VPVYERRVGDHVAERIRVLEGSEEDKKYSDLVASGAGNWLLADEAKSESEPEGEAPAPKRRGRPPANRTESK